MFYKGWALLILICAVPIQFAAQDQPQITLELGTVKVWLGMPKTTLEQKLAAAGFKMTEVAPHIWQISAGQHRYSVEFEGERLTAAERSWASKDETQVHAIIEALTALADERQACAIRRTPLSASRVQLDRVFVACGNRIVGIVNGTMDGRRVWDVSERITR